MAKKTTAKKNAKKKFGGKTMRATITSMMSSVSIASLVSSTATPNLSIAERKGYKVVKGGVIAN